VRGRGSPLGDGGARAFGVGAAGSIATADADRSGELLGESFELAAPLLGSSAVVPLLRLLDRVAQLGDAAPVLAFGLLVERRPGAALGAGSVGRLAGCQLEHVQLFTGLTQQPGDVVQALLVFQATARVAESERPEIALVPEDGLLRRRVRARRARGRRGQQRLGALQRRLHLHGAALLDGEVEVFARLGGAVGEVGKEELAEAQPDERDLGPEGDTLGCSETALVQLARLLGLSQPGGGRAEETPGRNGFTVQQGEIGERRERLRDGTDGLLILQPECRFQIYGETSGH